MINKVLIGLILLVLIGGVFGAVGCNLSVTEEAPPVSETPTPDTSTPETPDEEDVNEDMDETGAISTSAFVRKIESGEYEWPYRDIWVIVSGTVKSLEDYYFKLGTMEGPWDGYYVEFEPCRGFVVQWEFTKRNYDFEIVETLQSGQKVIIEGYLSHVYETTKKITMSSCNLVKVY
ncbi:hypothetical protein ES703_47764 [subsurface metagenome]